MDAERSDPLASVQLAAPTSDPVDPELLGLYSLAEPDEESAA